MKKTIRNIVGAIFLIPPILGVISFSLSLFGCQWKFASMQNLSPKWSCYAAKGGPHYEKKYGEIGTYYGATSATPIYLGLMAIAGAYLIKD